MNSPFYGIEDNGVPDLLLHQVREGRGTAWPQVRAYDAGRDLLELGVVLRPVLRGCHPDDLGEPGAE
ncbi:MAG: hypothetical protein R2789_04785 [Microthrixaceae bacterium]